MFRGRTDEHWTPSTPHHVLADTAQECSLDSIQTAGSHDDQIGPFVLGNTTDDLSWFLCGLLQAPFVMTLEG